MVDESEFEGDPEKTAYHDNKRELLKRGKEKGELTWDEIRDSLPEEFFNDVEMEVFLFTCKSMDIEVKGIPQSQ